MLYIYCILNSSWLHIVICSTVMEVDMSYTYFCTPYFILLRLVLIVGDFFFFLPHVAQSITLGSEGPCLNAQN